MDQKIFHQSKSSAFLGWLDSPEIVIREVAVVLDTYGLRHGVMAYEAAAASVPVAFPMWGKVLVEFKVYMNG